MNQDTQEYDPTKPLIWRISGDNFYTSYLNFNYDNNETDPSTFYKAGPVEQLNYNLKFTTPLQEHRLKKLDTIPWASFGILMNIKALKLLQETCPEDIQFFPVIIENDPQIKKLKPFKNKDYFFVHIRQIRNLINLEESTFSICKDGHTILTEEYTIKDIDNVNEIFIFKKLSLLPGSMEGSHLAKDPFNLGVIGVSKELADILTSSKVSGCKFLPDTLFKISNF